MSDSRSLSVSEVERRFVAEAEFDRAVVIRVCAWALVEGDEAEEEPDGPAKVDGADTAIAVVGNKLISVYNRHLHREDQVVEVTLSVGFLYPTELQLGQNKYAGLRKRLAAGHCARAAEPYISSVARQVADALGPIHTVPPVAYKDIQDLGAGD